MRNQFITQCEVDGIIPTAQSMAVFLVQFEGQEPTGQYLTEGILSSDHSEADDDEGFEAHTQGAQNATYLTNQAFIHHVTGQNVYKMRHDILPSQFLIEDRYSRVTFQGILTETGAANTSTVGREQLLALQQEDLNVVFDTSTAGQANIQFGKGKLISSIGSTILDTPVVKITFHVLNTPTPFLLSLGDMDRLKLYLDNTRDEIVQRTSKGLNRVPVVRKWGHAWFFLNKIGNATLFLTEPELRRLHCRFGHPAVERLHHILVKAGHAEETNRQVLEKINHFCHHCQMNDSVPHRFKFSLKDDANFNYEIIVDVMSLNGKPVLHVVDAATSFQGARFLPSMSAKDTWETLKALWIDTYQGPPDIITHDAGTNFASVEFKAEAKLMGVTCKRVPVEAHQSIGKVERYHVPLRRAFNILFAELTSTRPELILQMAVKAVNDTIGPDGLVPTLLVFGAYPHINQDSPPSPSMLKRADAIQKAMKELRQVQAKIYVNDTFNARNGPGTANIISLPLQSEVRVWREKHGWQGPYKIIAIGGHDITLDMVNGPVTFRSTLIRPYHRDDDGDERVSSSTPPPNADSQLGSEAMELHQRIEALMPRRRGRPTGSKSKPKPLPAPEQATAFITRKEEDDFKLALKLRAEGAINTPGEPFKESDAKEINDLITQGVFNFEMYDETKHGGHRIFGSRMVREVKSKTDKPYEKSRLVIAGQSDDEKRTLLTQSPTIQRMSQRLILSLAPTLIGKYRMSLTLRDITQAYTHAESKLDRLVFVRLPLELKSKYPEGTIMHVIRPLYGIAETGVHW